MSAPQTLIPDAGRQRLYAMELLRFFCTIPIVLVHLGGEYFSVAYTGFDAFVILSVALSLHSAQRKDFGPFARQRALRILTPWLLWSVFYLAIRALREGPGAALSLSDPNWLMVGGEIHLWFLPFILVTSLLTFAASRLPLAGSNQALWAGLTALAIAVGCLCYFIEQHHLLPTPWTQWSLAAPAILYGIARVLGPSWSAPVFLAGVIAGMSLLHSPLPALSLCAAALIFELFLRTKRIGPWAQPLGLAAFGIYLVHPFFIYVVAYFMPIEGNLPLAWALVFGASWGSAYAMLRAKKALGARFAAQRGQA
jgi:peptidoglycan/LPS O-acetylase OafA/YrhL